MKIINPRYKIKTELQGEDILRRIEKIGRVCYKSEDKITDESSKKFVQMLIDREHEAMIEHESITVRFVCDRGVSHELVRHRLASFAQESTRYCNYSKDKFGNELTVIDIATGFKYDAENARDALKWNAWFFAMESAEKQYFRMLELGATPQEARSVLPNSLATEVVVTANLREWRNILKLRTAKESHPQMRELMVPLLAEFKELIPVIFDDIN